MEMTGHGRLMIGLDLINRKEYEAALPWLSDAAASCQEDLLATFCNIAVVLGELGRSTEALEAIDQVLSLRPDHETARLNRAILLMQVQRFEEAIEDYGRVIEAGGDLKRAALFGRGFSNLVLGNLKEGFRGFEHRKKPNTPVPSLPEWEGGFPESEMTGTGPTTMLLPHGRAVRRLDGKTILVIGEMGFGDNIMFLRYAPMLLALGARVLVAVPPAMAPLAECVPGIKVVTEGSPRFDCWVRMMSLAHLFGTDIDTIPPPAKFDLPPGQLARWHLARWRAGMQGDRLKVGLCWSGSRESEYDRFRNIPLEALAPLFDIPGIDFYSLQVDVRDSDREAFDRLPLFDMAKQFKNFRDTACAISGLDLVITVDTSVAHLAGTMGVPAWVMLTSFRTYWLWIRGRSDNPWYPGMRAFRQTEDGDWAGVVARLTTRLRLLADQRQAIAS